jgi:hypothetical protein
MYAALGAVLLTAKPLWADVGIRGLVMLHVALGPRFRLSTAEAYGRGRPFEGSKGVASAPWSRCSHPILRFVSRCAALPSRSIFVGEHGRRA